MHPVALAALLAVAVMRAAGAEAAGAPAWLEWASSSTACGDAAAFAARVERALGRSPARAAADAHVSVTASATARPPAADAHVSVTASATARPPAAKPDPGWTGQIQLRADDQRSLGSRTIERRDPSCQPLLEAMALVTALALADDGIVQQEADGAGEGLAGASPPSVSPAAAEPTAPLAAPPAQRGDAPAAPESPAAPARAEPVAALSGSPTPSLTPVSRRWRSGVEGGAKLGLGLLPHAAFGAELSADLRTAAGWKFFLAFTGWQRQTSLDDGGRGASFQRLDLGVGLCPLTASRGWWDAAACLGGDVGRLSIAGVGLLSSSSTQDRLVLDAGLAAALNRRLGGPLAAGVTVAVMAPLIRDRISYGTTGGGEISVFREAPLAVVGSLRLSVVF